MQKNYIICNRKIRVEAECFPSDCHDWQIFEKSFDEPDFFVNCNVVEFLPAVEGKFCGRSGDFSIYCQGEKLSRKREMGAEEGLVSKHNYITGDSCEIYFTKNSARVFMDERYFWTSIPLANYLLTKKAVLMHSSFIDIGDSAVLFSAPCGTGKSTQAELWRVHRV